LIDALFEAAEIEALARMRSQGVPLFSVITVVLNDLPGLKATGESLAAQTLAEHEWIVIDGGSTDGSVEYLRESSANWISERDRGLYDAMNKGVDRAAGEHLIFMNAGDEFADESVLARLASVVLDRPQTTPALALIYGDALDYDADRPDVMLYRKARSERRIWYGLFARHQSMLFRREALSGLRYNPDNRIAGDYEFVARFLVERRAVCLYVPYPICKFRRGGLSYTNWRQALKEVNQVRTRSLGMGRAMRIALSCVQAPLAYLQAHRAPLYDWLRTRRLGGSSSALKDRGAGATAVARGPAE
jgi:putative colanic acid biosynthesis glycosyltransferase